MAGSDTLSRASASIARSHVVALETEQVGQETMDELGQQREALTRTRDRVRVSFLSAVKCFTVGDNVFYLNTRLSTPSLKIHLKI